MSNQATIVLRSACSGTVHHATIKVGRTVVYETRAWGTEHCAAEDAKAEAARLGLTVKEVK